MKYQVIDVQQFVHMLRFATRLLNVNKSAIDAMNVFPVPDGDTGTNMSMTMNSAMGEIDALTEVNMETVSRALARGALNGARGNSGVILSQILKGMSEVLKQKDVFGSKEFARALSKGAEVAYSAVTKPKEGTILTVIRMTAEGAESLLIKNNFVEVMKRVVARADEALRKTPDMLPVLKKANTVDAGGMGLLTIFRGFLAALNGEKMPEIEVAEAPSVDTSVLGTLTATDYGEAEDIEFGYCTEFLIINLFSKTTLADIDKLRDNLCKIGDCVVVIGDLQMVKVHVHTNQPNRALGYALTLGELEKVKIDNLKEQNRALNQQKKHREHVAMAVLSISSGDGIRAISEELGATLVIDGGQTMNPSVENILNSIREVNADTVIVLPNNKNIILATEQAKELAECEVLIVPSVSIVQGIRALMMLSPDLPARENYANMLQAYDEPLCLELTYAVKDTTQDDLTIIAGDVIAISGGKIIAAGKDIESTLGEALALIGSDKETMTMYYGNGLTEAQAQTTVDALAKQFPDIEATLMYGGQQHYYYLIGLD